MFLNNSQNSLKNTCVGVFFNKVAELTYNFIKIETLAQVFSSEFCEISKNTFSYGLPPVDASAACNFIKKEIPTKCLLENVFKTSWRRMAKMNILVLIKTSSEDEWLRWIYSSWSRRLEDVLKTSSSRRTFAGDLGLGKDKIIVNIKCLSMVKLMCIN